MFIYLLFYGYEVSVGDSSLLVPSSSILKTKKTTQTLPVPETVLMVTDVLGNNTLRLIFSRILVPFRHGEKTNPYITLILDTV